MHHRQLELKSKNVLSNRGEEQGISNSLNRLKYDGLINFYDIRVTVLNKVQIHVKVMQLLP